MTTLAKPGKRLKVLFAAIVLVAGAVAMYTLVIAPHLRSQRLDRLLAAFKAGPCDATAEPLLKLLNAGKATEEEGAAILELLLEPDVEIAQPCAAGKPITILIRPKHNLRDRSGLLIVDNTSVSVRDGQANYSAANSRTLAEAWYGWLLHLEPTTVPTEALIIDRPGVYAGHLQLEYSFFSIDAMEFFTEFPVPFIRPPAARSLWQQALDLPKDMWAKLTALFDSDPRGLMIYSCEFKVPVRIHVVSSEDAATAPATRPSTKPRQDRVLLLQVRNTVRDKRPPGDQGGQ